MITSTGVASFRSLIAATALLTVGPLGGHALMAPQTPNSPVERIGRDELRLGRIRVNLATSEIRVPALVNPVTVIEFFANKAGGVKAYESALTLETDGVMFNTALLMIGMDNSPLVGGRGGVTPAMMAARKLEMSVEVPGTPPQRFPADRLIFDRKTNAEVPASTWMYIGSTMLDGRYLADVDGTLIGFMHGRDPVIERFETVGVGRYGEIILNPTLGLRPGEAVTLIIKADAQPETHR